MDKKDADKLAYLAHNNEIVINEAIFAEIAMNNKQAFTQLYEASRKAVYAYLMTYVKNPEDAADLMQDTYLKIRSAAHLYQSYGKPMAWIFTIARNLALMKLRSDKSHPQDELDEHFAEHSDAHQQTEQKIILEEAMKILSEDDCRIVVLHAVAGVKHREIAQMLNLSLTATLNRYNRALKKLKKHIGGEHYE